MASAFEGEVVVGQTSVFVNNISNGTTTTNLYTVPTGRYALIDILAFQGDVDLVVGGAGIGIDYQLDTFVNGVGGIYSLPVRILLLSDQAIAYRRNTGIVSCFITIREYLNA